MRLTELVGGLLPALNDALPHRLVPVLREFLREHADARDVEVLVVDYGLSELRRLPASGDAVPAGTHPGDGGAVDDTAVGVDGTSAGSCFGEQVVVPVPEPDGLRLLVPVSLRAERIGVLDVLLPEDRPVTPDLLAGLQDVAVTTAYALVACGAFSDFVEVTRRAQPLSVEAEMQWNLQPLRAFSSERLAVAGQLVPSYEVGGDCYDYSVSSEHLDLASLDAMGHGVGASLLAALVTAVLRNARRAGAAPAEQLRRADRQVARHFSDDQFVTALLLRLRQADGAVEAVNAGHPSPWLLRDGRASPVPFEPDLPVGMLGETAYRPSTLQLRPGDRLVLVTDGVLEAGAPGEEFGEDRLEGLLLATAALTPHQCVGEVLRTVRAFAPQMHDDATVVVLDWHGPAG